MEVFAHYGPAPLETENAWGDLDVRYPRWFAVALTPGEAQIAFNKEHPAYSEARFLGIVGTLWTAVTEMGHGNLLVKIRPGVRGGADSGAAADLAGLDNCLVIFAVARAGTGDGGLERGEPRSRPVDYCIDYREFASEAEMADAVAAGRVAPRLFVQA